MTGPDRRQRCLVPRLGQYDALHAFTRHAIDAGARYTPRNWIERKAALPVRGFD
jgi:hypothetical protein